MARNVCPRCGDTGRLPLRGIGSTTAPGGRRGALCSCPRGAEVGRRDAALDELILRGQRDATVNNQSQFQTPAPPSVLPPMPARRESSLVRDLETLAELHEKGLLTEEEFDAAKTRLLGS